MVYKVFLRDSAFSRCALWIFKLGLCSRIIRKHSVQRKDCLLSVFREQGRGIELYRKGEPVI